MRAEFNGPALLRVQSSLRATSVASRWSSSSHATGLPSAIASAIESIRSSLISSGSGVTRHLLRKPNERTTDSHLRRSGTRLAQGLGDFRPRKPHFHAGDDAFTILRL